MEFLSAAETFVNEGVFKTMAWVFTVLSGVASIALTIHKFGLSKGKQISLIVGILAFGLIMVLVIIPRLPASAMHGGPAITVEQAISSEVTQQLQVLASELGNYSGGYEKSEAGLVSKPLRGEVNRVSEHVFAVMHPNGHFDAIYSGDFFTATLDEKEINCELIDVGGDRVLIVMGDDTEFINLNSDQTKNTFKVRKVPVKEPLPGSEA